MSVRRLVLGFVSSLCVVGWFVALAGPAVAVQPGARQIGASECHGFAGECEAAGQLSGPVGVAVNNDSFSLSSGDLYVVDSGDRRVDRFAASSGAFGLAWGSGVVNGASELQTCTTSCRSGLREENPPYVNGGISYGSGVAVDSDPLSLSAGDVYVVTQGTSRVEKFGPGGEFLLTFGGGVNKKGGDVCTKAEENECQQGTVGSADGQFNDGVSSVAVGPGGRVFVGDRARVQVFEPSGAWRETISLSGLSSTGAVTGLAVDSSGDLFVADEGVAGVREFRLIAGKWTESAGKLDEGSTSIASLAVDPAGNLYVGDTEGGSDFGFHVLKYNPSGKAVGNFGSGTVRGGSTELVEGERQQKQPFGRNGMAFSEASGSPELYASESYEEKAEHSGELSTFHYSVWALPVPPPGPSIAGESAKSEPRGSVSLEATVNPEGNETSYHFEYLSDADFNKEVGGKKCEWSCAASTLPGTLPASSENRAASTKVTGLAVSAVYHYRVLASNSEGAATGPGQTVETLPAALLEAQYATNVASTSATVDAQVNALGSSTEYRLQYGRTTAYEEAPVTGSAGEGIVGVLLSPHLQALSPGTLYHYRFVLHNELGSVEGADQSFTTQPPGGGLTLPDGRAWELASPANRSGALLEPYYPGGGGLLQAASDGSGVTYLTEGPGVGEEGPQGHITWSRILSLRHSPGVWGSADLTLPGRLPPEGALALGSSIVHPEYQLFSQDLSLAAVEPQKVGTPPLSPESSERTVYLRNDPVCASQPAGCYTPLVTAGNVPPETKFGGGETKAEQMHFVTATPDLGHVVLESPFALTAQANNNYFPGLDQWNLYEWSAGRLQLVNILPNGEATHGVSPDVRLADGFDTEGTPTAVIPSAISGDGRRIAWDLGVPYADAQWSLFVRDMVEERTVRVGGPHAVFQWMSSDGARVFFIEGGDLYVFDFASGTASDLTAAHGAPASGDAGAGVQEIVSDVSRDGSNVYFVSTSVLQGVAGPVGGADNLYLLRDTAGGWSTTFIATLSPVDLPDWKQSNATAVRGGHDSDLSKVTSRVSPSGRYLAFMSERSLTGYDNTDANSPPGRPRHDEEVFLYDAATGRLVCASCNPTGARPVGVLDQIDVHGAEGTLLSDRQGIWTDTQGLTNHWLAASIPAWDESKGVGSQYQPRYLSDSGRLFFDSPDVLVPQDTNGVMDVYEYEPAGVGGEAGCASSSPAFSERSGGCVSLISSGASTAESAFFDASENGDDVFFITTSKLVRADSGNAYQVYDAHVCGSEGVPCVSEPVSPPPCASGDSCKPAPSPQPEIFGPAPSATFSGAGNLAGGRAPNPPVVKGKTVKCSKGKKLSHGKCIKTKSKKKAKKATTHRRARR